MWGPLVSTSGRQASVGETLGYWLDESDVVSTESRRAADIGPIGFPRDWPAVYSSSRALKSLVGKKGRCAGKQVVVLGAPAQEHCQMVEGVHFQPMQSFSNAERAREAAQLQVCRGWAVFEHLDMPAGAAFVAERFWWNALPDGTWVDFTPRPKDWKMLLVAQAADGAPKDMSQLTPERAALASCLFSLRFGAAVAAKTPEAPGAVPPAMSAMAAATAPAMAIAAAPAAAAAPVAVAEAGPHADAAAALREELARAAREADEACAQLRRLETSAAELRARLRGAPPQHARWNPPGGAERLRVGSLALIDGLKEAADLNGQEVTLALWDERRGRWKVRLRTGEVRALLPWNLELLDEVKERPELTTFGCEIIGQLPLESGEVQYHLWPLVYSGILRVRIPERLFARLNVQFDRLYANARSSSHAPFLQGEMREGRQLTVKEPDEEYTSLLLACSEKLSKAVLGEEAKDFQYKLDTVWTVHQLAGDYNPVHFHNNARSHFGFSSFLHLQLPEQLNVGQAWVPKSGAKGYHDGMTSFIWRPDSGLCREHLENPGVLECELLEGFLYVFPQWVQHFVWPFRGPGERRTVAANISLLGPSERRGLQPAGGGGGLYR